jgi:hypothetical protein
VQMWELLCGIHLFESFPFEMTVDMPGQSICSPKGISVRSSLGHKDRTPKNTQGPYSATCSNLRRSKLLQKSSVPKFVNLFAALPNVFFFFYLPNLKNLLNFADVIFETEMHNLRAKTF